jgi:hypothetical protein
VEDTTRETLLQDKGAADFAKERILKYETGFDKSDFNAIFYVVKPMLLTI